MNSPKTAPAKNPDDTHLTNPDAPHIPIQDRVVMTMFLVFCLLFGVMLLIDLFAGFLR